jgi:hypothetical protein
VGTSEDDYNTENPLKPPVIVASFKFYQRQASLKVGQDVDEMKCTAQTDENKKRMKTVI